MTSQERLRELFTYTDDGYLVRRIRTSNCVRVGDVVGSLGSGGYTMVMVDGKRYQTHRLIYLYHHGVLPKQIDHIDRNPMNNRIANLRPCTTSQNQANQNHQRGNSSQWRGVSWREKWGKWVAQIAVNKKKMHLGHFDYECDAAMAYNEAALEHFGEFAHLNEHCKETVR